MDILFIERKINEGEISIEKLFSTIRGQLTKENVGCIVQKNPYSFSVSGILKALFFFHRNQKKINHITGDIHWAVLALKRNNTVLTIHDIGGILDYGGLKKKLYYIWWLYLPLKKAKYITAISQKTKDDIVGILPWAESKIRVIPNCFTITEIFSAEKKFTQKPEILIVGTRSNKNIERVILALQGISCQLTIVGDLSVKHLQLLEDCGIHYANFSRISDDELLALYRKAHIVPFVSTFEGFGLPILEAQSQNCIVLTSNIEPMLDVAGEGAFFVDPYQVESIQNGFYEIISNINLRQTLLQAGLQNLKRFEVKTITQRYIQLYEEVMLNGFKD